jgi:CheY-like chemotaxis protein
MLAYAGHGTEIVGPVDLGVATRQMAILLKASMPDNVTVRYDLGPGLPPVRGDAGQIQQILMNLIINAAEAIGLVQGAVHVCTYAACLEPGSIDESTEAPVEPGRYVCLEVTDTGLGMDSITRRRIFEPFFSTKFAGRGLGLAAVAGIVRSQGGAIMVASQPGLGTTFQVYLRPAEGQAAAADAEHAVEPLPPAGGLIVIADDEDLVRAFCRTALETAGYAVLAAADGLEAVGLVRGHRAEIAAVLLDLYMPTMDGIEALARIRGMDPAIPVLVLSGYAEGDVSSRIGSDVRFLQKPFTVESLVTTVRSVIDSARTAGHAAKASAKVPA